MPELAVHSEAELLALCAGLGAGPRRAARAGLRGAERAPGALVADKAAEIRDAVRAGDDPLGRAYCALVSARQRRRRGATYTPAAIVESMVAWAARACDPVRVVDPRAGSGRFLLAAARAFPRARLVGVEVDPVAAAVDSRRRGFRIARRSCSRTTGTSRFRGA